MSQGYGEEPQGYGEAPYGDPTAFVGICGQGSVVPLLSATGSVVVDISASGQIND
jgi:hypothetical protein